jgi:hypothetical protein
MTHLFRLVLFWSGGFIMINGILTTGSPSHRPDQHPQIYNSHFATTGQATAVRYAIDDELWESFTVEQVTKQIGLLRETGRFREPNNGGPFVVRVSQYALMGEPAVIAQRDLLVEQGHLNVSRTDEAQCFYDFSFDGDTRTTTVATRLRVPGSLNWTQRREEYERKLAEVLWKEDVIQIWWEKDYVCTRVKVPPEECEEFPEIYEMASHVVVILLQDRTANKMEITSTKKPRLNLPFIKRRPQIPDNENFSEIVLTIPRRVYRSTSGKGHESHRSPRMHYRAEYVRRQQIGPRSAPSYKEVVIPGTWINASDISPADLGTPITRRNYRFKAVRRKEESHTP